MNSEKNLKQNKNLIDLSQQMENIRFLFFINPEYTISSETRVQKKHFNHFVLYILLSGTAQVQTEHQQYKLHAGDFFMICPNLSTSVYSISGQGECLEMELEYQYLDKEINEDLYAVFHELLSEKKYVHLKNQPEYSAAAQYILQDLSDRAPGFLYRLRTHLGSLLFLMFDTLSVLTNESFFQEEESKPQIHKYKRSNMRDIFIDSYLEEHFKENLTLEMLAQKVLLSTKQLNRIINRLYGTTFYKHLTQLRIREAKRLLTQTDLSIEEISYLVGFATHTGFYKAFKQTTGQVPSAYRAKNKKTGG